MEEKVEQRPAGSPKEREREKWDGEKKMKEV